MSEWSGFSDADLERMKRDLEPQNHPKFVKPVTGGRKKAALGGRVPKKTIPKTVNKHGQKIGGAVPAAALLSKPQQMPKEPQNPSSPPVTPTDHIPLHGKSDSLGCDEVSKEGKDEGNSNENDSTCKDPELVEDVEIIKKKEKLKLEDVQRRQKEMEEKNKRKKTMLTKAIAERKKKAFAESNKLVKIQSELSKLDIMLNYDVSILRDKIDQACMDFNLAKKRFDKAEVEYIDAKMSLHKATEFKEDLTEHLYHLIQLNEERKAKKLEELMHKLELEENSDDNAEAEMKEEAKDEKMKLEAKSENGEASKSGGTTQIDQLKNEECHKETEISNTEAKMENNSEENTHVKSGGEEE